MTARSYNSSVSGKSKMPYETPMREDIYCHCGIIAEIRTSWKDSNPSGRFYGCSKFGAKDACDFFLWYDPKICERATKVIPGLLRKMNKLKSEVRKLNAKSKGLCIAFLCYLVILIAIVLNFRMVV